MASKGGAPENPEWFYNLESHPDEVVDSGRARAVRRLGARGDAATRRRSGGSAPVAAYPPYAEYQEKTDRQIPVFIATPKGA